MIKNAARIAAAAAASTLVSMLFVGSFVGALHDPAPHGIPVGVAGPAAAARQLDAAFARQAPGAFTVSAYPTVGAARQAILNRDADAVLVPGPARQQLLMAGAAGGFAAQAVTTAFTAEAAASGQHLAIADVRPMPPGDPNGSAPLFFFIGLALPGAVFGVLFASVLGRHKDGPAQARELPWPARLAVLAAYAIGISAAASWVADGLTGALPGAPAALVGMGALTAFAVSSACYAAWRLTGPPLTALLILLFIPVGVPASGGPMGPAFVTGWYAHLGAALPAGATVSAVRDIISFGGSALAGPLTVLCLWAGIAATAVALPSPRLHRRHRLPAAAAAGVGAPA